MYGNILMICGGLMDCDSDQRGYVVGRGDWGGRGGAVTVLLGPDRATEGRWRWEMGSSFGTSSHRWLLRWHFILGSGVREYVVVHKSYTVP